MPTNNCELNEYVEIATRIAIEGPRDSFDFLLRCAVFPFFSIEMAAQLTGRRDANSICRWLADNEYLGRHTNSTGLFSFENKFRGYLLVENHNRYTPGYFQQLVKDAATISAHNSHYPAAFQIYAEKGDWRGAASLLNCYAKRLYESGAKKELEELIHALPNEIVRHQANLKYWYAMCLRDLQPEKASLVFQEAYQLHANDALLEEQIHDLAGMLTTLCFSSALSAAHFKYIDHLQILLKGDLTEVSANAKASGYAALLSSAAYRFTEYGSHSMYMWACRLKKLTLSPINYEVKLSAAVAMSSYYVMAGMLERAENVIMTTPQEAQESHVSLQVLAWWYVAKARFFRITGRHDEALECFSRFEEIAKKNGLKYLEPQAFLGRIFDHMSSGNKDAAEQILTKIEPVLLYGRQIQQAMFYGAKTWYALIDGAPSAALRYAKLQAEIAAPLKLAMLNVFSEMLLASAYIELGDTKSAEHVNRRLKVSSNKVNSAVLSFQVHLIDASLAIRGADEERVSASLQKAFYIARNHGLTRTVFWLPLEMSRLCTAALLRGIECSYVTELIRARKIPPPVENPIESWPWSIKIYSFGAFNVLKHNEPLTFTGKAQRKPLEFLKLLVALEGKDVSTSIIIETLWPDSEGDAAQRSFDSTLYRLRKLLGNEDAIKLVDKKVSLDPRQCWVDLWKFRNLLSQGESFIPPQVPDQFLKRETTKVERALKLYRGDFLQMEETMPWMLPVREKTKSTLLRRAAMAGTMFEESEQWTGAIEIYSRALEVDPLSEELYRRLMECHWQRGEIPDAIQIFRRCREMLSIVLGTQPSKKTVDIYRRLIAN